MRIGGASVNNKIRVARTKGGRRSDRVALTESLQRKPKRVRKNAYRAHLAAANFKPTEDWTNEEAQRLYEVARFPYKVDRILYEDCIEGMKKLPAESIDVVVADPPFGLSFTGTESIYNRDYLLVREGYREAVGDYQQFSIRWIQQLPRIMKNTSSAWIFSGWTNLGDVLSAVRRSGLTLVNHIIWKYQFGVFTQRKFVTSHYHILFLTKSAKYYFNKIMHYPLDVWEINRTYRAGEQKNSTKLPEELVLRCIEFTSRPGCLILDPFMGNGTTAVAAKGSYRHHIGFEINKSMRDVIDANLNSTQHGQFYTPYADRPDELVRSARRRFRIGNLRQSDQERIVAWT